MDKSLKPAIRAVPQLLSRLTGYVEQARPLPVLAGLIALGAVLRFAFWHPYAAEYPDEIYQYLERAHQLVYHFGIVTWEQRFGIRNWLIPQMLATVMWLARPLSADPIFPVLAARAAAVALSLLLIPAAWMLGRMHSRAGGFLAAFVVAIWPQVVAASLLLLSELFSAIAVICGAALALRFRDSKAYVAAAGFLLMLGIVLRIQSAVFVGVFVIAHARLDFKVWLRLGVGGLLALALGAASDLAMHMAPYEWVWKNFEINVLEGQASYFGKEGHLYYARELLRTSGWTFPVLAVLSLFCTARQRPLVLAAVAECAALTFIPHKELRFVMIGMIVVTTLAPVGALNILGWLRRRWPDRVAAEMLLVLPALFCLMAGPAAKGAIVLPDKGVFARLVRSAAMRPQTCGIAVPTRWWGAQAYSFARRRLPLYVTTTDWDWWPDPMTVPGPVLRAANALVSDPGRRGLEGWHPVKCLKNRDRTACLYVRPGTCQPAGARVYNVQQVFNLHY